MLATTRQLIYMVILDLVPFPVRNASDFANRLIEFVNCCSGPHREPELEEKVAMLLGMGFDEVKIVSYSFDFCFLFFLF